MKHCEIILLLFLGQFIASVQAFTQDVNVSSVNTLIQFCDSTKADEILMTYKGNIIAEWKRTACDSMYMNTASMVKSWTGLVVGILIDKKMIDSVNTPVCRYIPEWKAGCENQVTIRHLLTMTAGLNKTRGEGILSKGDMNSYALSVIPDTLPGIRFSYSNESVQLLGIIIERVTGKDVDVIFEKFLFHPLEMDSTALVADSAGNVVVYGGCRTTVSDAIKIGQLMLNNGAYKETQIVSDKWITESVTPGRLSPFYGYLWWIDASSSNWNFAATGDLGNMTIVFPTLDLVFVRRQNCDLSRNSLNMAWMGPHFLQLISNVLNQ